MVYHKQTYISRRCQIRHVHVPQVPDQVHFSLWSTKCSFVKSIYANKQTASRWWDSDARQLAWRCNIQPTQFELVPRGSRWTWISEQLNFDSLVCFQMGSTPWRTTTWSDLISLWSYRSFSIGMERMYICERSGRTYVHCFGRGPQSRIRLWSWHTAEIALYDGWYWHTGTFAGTKADLFKVMRLDWFISASLRGCYARVSIVQMMRAPEVEPIPRTE